MRRGFICFNLMLILALAVSCQVVQPTQAPTVEPSEVLPPTAAPEPTQPPTPEPAAEATIVLDVIGPDKTVAMTMQDLKALPAHEGWGGIKTSTGQIILPSQFKGVTFEELAALVGGISADAGVSVVARDGYAMTFSYDQAVGGELITYDPATGDEIVLEEPLQVVLAYEKDGESIPESGEGPLRVVALTSKNNQVIDGHWSVKWVNQVVLKPLGQDWTVQLEGALTEEIDRGTFESCTAPGCHQATWTDEKAQEWTGVPLWLLLGYVDDENKHSDDAYAEELAEQGYPVQVIAADGYSVTFDSARLHRNDNILVADKVNGNPLDEKSFPLRLVGPDLQKNEMVSQIAQILLEMSGEMTEAAPVAQPTEVAEAPTEETPVEAPAGDAALRISGSVEEPQSLSWEALQDLEVVEVSVEHPKTGMQTYQGVHLNTLLGLARPTGGANKLAIAASDGYQVEINLADVQACIDCLIALQDDQLLAIMPGMESSFWVKDVTTLEVK